MLQAAGHIYRKNPQDASAGASAASDVNSGPFPTTIAFPLGPGPHFGPDPLARSLSRSGQGHFSTQDGPGPPTKVPGAAQDHRKRSQEHLGTATSRCQRQPKPANMGSRAAQERHFRCSFTAILPCCSAAWPAPLPLSTFTAFLGFYCLVDLLPGLLRCLGRLLLPFWAWATLSAPLPLSTFTAFLGFYCLCRSAAWPAPLPLSTFTAFLGMGDFVDFYSLSGLLLPLSTFTESVDCC